MDSLAVVNANGIQQRYRIIGTRGPWVTLVHGSADNLMAWSLQVPSLSKRFRVLIYDVRGHGETETPASEPITQVTYVEDLHQLLRALKIRSTAVVGYSMGGGIARNFAATYPALVWGAVLSNGGSRLDPPSDPSGDRAAEMDKMRQERIASIRSRGMVAVFEGWLDNQYTQEFVAARPEIVDWHRSITTSNDPEKYIRTLIGGTSSNIDLSKITAPLMIIVGAGDGYNPAGVANEFAQALKGTKPEVNVFPTRHGSPFERYEEYNQTLLDFLGRNKPHRK